MQKQELIKPIVRVGNSAGVVLPKEWLNGKARIELIEQPLDIKSETLEILTPYLEEIQGLYIVGSYARGEQTAKSDVDILGITESLNKTIVKGKYHILLVSKTELESQLEKNALPLLPMIKEASPVLNKNLLEKYKKTKLTKKNLNWHIETTRSALKVVEKIIDLDEELENDKIHGGVYSLVLRLRTLYLIDCLKRNKIWSTKELISLIKKITGNDKAYKIYLDEKESKKPKERISLDDGHKLIEYIAKKLKETEKWLNEKKE